MRDKYKVVHSDRLYRVPYTMQLGQTQLQFNDGRIHRDTIGDDFSETSTLNKQPYLDPMHVDDGHKTINCSIHNIEHKLGNEWITP